MIILLKPAVRPSETRVIPWSRVLPQPLLLCGPGTISYVSGSFMIDGLGLQKDGVTTMAEINRYRCKLCGYVYSPLRGEPHNGIPAGTAFEDLPETYLCPICGMEGKGKIGKWGFDEWVPTKYICSVCEYVYDQDRGEPHRGIKAGTPFSKLPDDYRCPVCNLDPKIKAAFGPVGTSGFGPLYI